MLETLKIGGIWQMWNVACDGSIIVENWHRNMGFFKNYASKEVKTLVNALKSIKPVFSLSADFSTVVLDLDLQRAPSAFHVFDYVRLQDTGIDIRAYFQVTDLRLGSFVVFQGRIFTAERIADELDTYPGHPFLPRHLIGQKPAPIESKEIMKIIIPSREDVKSMLLQAARQSCYGEPEESERHKLEEEVEEYLDIYCYPDLHLKIPVSHHSR